jgi:uncharacterized protein YjiS (DUF1127 family)
MRPGPIAAAGQSGASGKAGRTSFLPLLSGHLGAAIAWLGQQRERQRGRRALLRMSDAQLKDIGLSRSTAYREANRTFWERGAC